MSDAPAGTSGLGFHAYGVSVGVRSDSPEVIDELPEYLPPGWRPASFTNVPTVFAICAPAREEAEWCVRTDTGGEVRFPGRLAALEYFESTCHLYVAEHARDLAFIHAGVVGLGDAVALFPGRSRAGKSMLTRACVRAGALFYSDEFAILDREGKVHPFPRPLSIRRGEGKRADRVSVEAVGGRVAAGPGRVALVLMTRFVPDAVWAPRALTRGQGVLSLLDNAPGARAHPDTVLTIVSEALREACVLETERGEAEETAVRVLELLSERGMYKRGMG